MNEARFRVDQIHSRAESIERIDEGCELCRLELEHPADQHRTPDVRSDQPHLPARPVIDDAVSFVAEHSEDGDADRRALDHRGKEIDIAERLRPLTIQFGLGQFPERDQIGGCDRLFKVAKEVPLCR